MKKKIAVLGSTGSVGRQTLQIIESHPDDFELVALTAHSNTDLLAQQTLKFKPKYAGIVDVNAFAHAKETFPLGVKLLTGKECLLEVCALKEVDVVVMAVVGISGLLALMQAIKCGKTIATANKEALVCGGKLVNDALKKSPNAKIIPVDSEHSAIFQCLQGLKRQEVHKIILTSSGGPFKYWEKEKIKEAKAKDALNHPVWSMGQKITIDSATMMNKGLEIIEAKWLFDVLPQEIEVVVHPEAIIHSMVEAVDGAVLAQMGLPDMKLPIQYALYYPGARRHMQHYLDFKRIQELTFFLPDYDKFPCLSLAKRALNMGGGACVALNSANEAAVELYLRDMIKFYDISTAVELAMEQFGTEKEPAISEILRIDEESRKFVYKRFNQ